MIKSPHVFWRHIAVVLVLITLSGFASAQERVPQEGTVPSITSVTQPAVAASVHKDSGVDGATTAAPSPAAAEESDARPMARPTVNTEISFEEFLEAMLEWKEATPDYASAMEEWELDLFEQGNLDLLYKHLQSKAEKAAIEIKN